MANTSWQTIMRVFFEYDTKLALYIEKGKIKGLINKAQLEKQGSDLSTLVRDDLSIPINTIESLEELLTIHQSEAIEIENMQVLPVINKSYEFVGLWGKQDVIKAWQAIPEIKVWKPPIYSNKNTSQATLPNNETEEGIIHRKKVIQITKPMQESITKKVINVERKVQTLYSTTKTKHNIKKAVKKLKSQNIDFLNHLAVLSLEALPLPLIAVSPSGEVYFYNEDWHKLQKKTASWPKIEEIINTSKKIIAELAMKGELNIERPIIVPLENCAEQLFLKALRQKNSENSFETIAYLLWHETKKDSPKGENKNVKIAPKKNSLNDSSQVSKDYLGRTLPEIIKEEEEKALNWAMQESGENQSNAAMLLGIPRQTFSYKYNKLIKNKK